MDWHCYIGWAVIVAQWVFVYGAVRNYRYVRLKSTERKETARPSRVALIIPCKGLDTRFHSNIRSFFEQDYDNYRLFFVVEAESDPAFRELNALRERFGRDSRALDIQILVAGRCRASSQKIFNLLYGYQHVPDDTETLAFADSDVCVQRDWLRRLVRPLRRPKCGVATGYRWFVPLRNNLATLALSAINGAVAQSLGNTPFNQAWGGSMAMRLADFQRLGIPEIWSNTLSDDLSLSQAVKRAGMKVHFVPECLVASFESMTWSRVLEFGRRQFLITRVYAPCTWWLGLLSSLGSVVGLWGTAAVAIHAVVTRADHALLVVAIACLFLAGQLARVVLRQLTAAQILTEHLPRLVPAAMADVFGCWLWSILLLASLLSSAFGRTIRWRGIRYRLVSPTQTVILDGAGSSIGSSSPT
ncbi:MAG TPA: glycosyltransferase [Sedimentisphaerales bacterium]|jgi:cellulose synthase/poly-beta-1,6-N-acetylglucosamine synthase-like glycosyltransferase|nr:glycosyltransferase [Sedimentisphaerales bacterium]HNU28218.1 glycosyltransferase [Sedimentisphaerales bacterium]